MNMPYNDEMTLADHCRRADIRVRTAIIAKLGTLAANQSDEFPVDLSRELWNPLAAQIYDDEREVGRTDRVSPRIKHLDVTVIATHPICALVEMQMGNDENTVFDQNVYDDMQ
jgi:hypothetical protein